MKKKKQNKSKLEKKVSHEDIADEAMKLNVYHNNIICTRLRQPIQLKKHKQEITGYCSLDGKFCHYYYPKKRFECPYCKE